MQLNGVVQRKFALLDKHLLRLESDMQNVSFEKFKDNWILQKMAERVLQVMIEMVIDIAERIIALKDAGPAATAAEAIEKLVELSIVNSSDPYIDMIRFRNLIVHQYEEIDPTIVFNIIKNKLDSFRKFRDEIDKL